MHWAACWLAAILVFPTLGKADEGSPGVVLDMASPESSSWTGYGWSRPEQHGQDAFRWISRIEADTLVELDESRNWRFTMRAAPLYLPGKIQLAALYVNGSFVKEWTCVDDPAYRDYTADIGMDLLVPGTNRVTLRMAYKRRIPPDRRELSLRVQSMKFEELDR